MIVENIPEAAVLEEGNRVQEFRGDTRIFSLSAFKDRVEIFLEQNLKKGTRRTGCAGTQRSCDFRRQIPQYGNDSCGIGGKGTEELKIPFVASGGMADGRSLVAALALGADGMNMGTRFIATKEAPVHDNVKQAIVTASELDTRLVMRPLRNTERVLRNAATDALLEKERRLGAAIKFEDIIAEVAGVYPKIMIDGDMDAGVWSCGMVAGLIRDVPSCKELVDRIMAEAESLITRRLAGFVGVAA